MYTCTGNFLKWFKKSFFLKLCQNACIFIIYFSLFYFLFLILLFCWLFLFYICYCIADISVVLLARNVFRLVISIRLWQGFILPFFGNKNLYIYIYLQLCFVPLIIEEKSIIKGGFPIYWYIFIFIELLDNYINARYIGSQIL